MAAGTDAGLALATALIRQKIGGHTAVLRQLGTSTGRDPVLTAPPEIGDLDTLKRWEADAANAYWSAWANEPIRWVSRDANTVPDHWRIFGSRTSPLTNSPRRAVNPANALLKYAYALLEVESRIALRIEGLYPGLGVLHVDTPARDSFALDVMEAGRPAVDQWVLGVLRTHTFSRHDVCQLPNGTCSLLPDFALTVSETLPRWREVITPVAEWVASYLAGQSLPDLPTPHRQKRMDARFPPSQTRRY